MFQSVIICLNNESFPHLHIPSDMGPYFSEPPFNPFLIKCGLPDSIIGSSLHLGMDLRFLTTLPNPPSIKFQNNTLINKWHRWNINRSPLSLGNDKFPKPHRDNDRISWISYRKAWQLPRWPEGLHRLTLTVVRYWLGGFIPALLWDLPNPMPGLNSALQQNMKTSQANPYLM